MDVRLYVNCRAPRDAPIRRLWYAADMDIREQSRTVIRGAHGANAERRPHNLAINDRRSRIPTFASGRIIETFNSLKASIHKAHQSGIVISADESLTP